MANTRSGRCQGVRGLYVAGGCCVGGLSIAPAIGEALAAGSPTARRRWICRRWRPGAKGQWTRSCCGWPADCTTHIIIGRRCRSRSLTGARQSEVPARARVHRTFLLCPNPRPAPPDRARLGAPQAMDGERGVSQIPAPPLLFPSHRDIPEHFHPTSAPSAAVRRGSLRRCPAAGR